jgi:hypothetical protein
MLGRREMIIINQYKKRKSVIIEALHEDSEGTLTSMIVGSPQWEGDLDCMTLEEYVLDGSTLEERAMKRAQDNYNIAWR